MLHSIVCLSLTRNEAPGDLVSVASASGDPLTPASLHQMLGGRHQSDHRGQGTGEGSPGLRTGALTSRPRRPELART